MENRNNLKIHVVKYRWLWMALTALLLLPGIVVMIYASITSPDHLPLKVGIDYTGGTVVQYTIDKKVDNQSISDLRLALEEKGIDNPALQVINVNENSDIISIRTKFIAEEDNETMNTITSTVKTKYKNSLIALTLACLGIIVYLSFRFQFDFALAAILALIHDVLFVVGVFAILSYFCNVQIDGLFITALLTVIGFSVHDTIVVFDRIRENLRYYSKKMTFGEIVDASVTQTFVRSINTSLTVLITLLALYFFGGVTTKDFVLAMTLGIGIGTYSSIFFASMLLDFWKDNKNQPKKA